MVLPLKRAHNRACSVVRAFCFGDGSADDQYARTIVTGLSGRHSAFLVGGGTASGAKAGDDEETILPRLFRGFHFMTRTDNAVEASLLRERGQAIMGTL